jgi:hypothetical protein
MGMQAALAPMALHFHHHHSRIAHLAQLLTNRFQSLRPDHRFYL